MISSDAPATSRESTWRTSSRCNPNGGDCIEVGPLANGSEGLRDTKDKDNGPVLTFQSGQISALAAAIQNGQFG